MSIKQTLFILDSLELSKKLDTQLYNKFCLD